MRLRNKKTHFTSLAEGTPPPNRGKRFTARLYFVLLFAILGYLVYHGVMRILYLKTRGQVEVARTVVHATAGGTIAEILVRPGETVQAGTVLATIQPPPKALPSLAKEILKAQQEEAETGGELDRVRAMMVALEAAAGGGKGDGPDASTPLPKSIMKADSDIRLQRVTLAGLEGRRQLVADLLKQRGERAARQRLLELSRQDPQEEETLRRELQELEVTTGGAGQGLKALQQYRAEQWQAEVAELRRQAATLADTLKAQQAYLAGLRAEGQDTPPATAGRITAPVHGTVQAVFKLTGAQADAGEALLALQAPEAEVVIQGYFAENQLSHLQPNKPVRLLFPDQVRGQGVIRNHYAAAVTYRDPIKDKYIPLESLLQVEIAPVDAVAGAVWRKFDRMDVTIWVRRW